MAEAQGIQGSGIGQNHLMVNIGRRLELDIPIHLDDDEHRWYDGYCNCGEKEPTKQRKVRHINAVTFHVPRPRTNLDYIERNREDY